MSFGSLAIRAGFRLIRLNRWINRTFLSPGRGSSSMDAARFPAHLHPESWSLAGSKLLTLHARQKSDQHLIYFPGGAYLMEPTLLHRWFLQKLVEKAGLAATYVDYPKAPENTYQRTHELVLKAYQEVTLKYPAREYILLGDSAGGGLALALVQALRAQDIQPFPGKTILLSPWLDLSLVNQQIPAFAARDSLLPLDGLVYAAEQYSGGEDLKNPLLSPIYGQMADLGRILVIFGTEELFYPECQLLVAKVSEAQGSEIKSLIGEGMIHDWVLFPVKESREGLEEIVRFIAE